MSILQNSELWRGGESNQYIQNETGVTISVAPGGPTEHRATDTGIRISSKMPSKGGGTTIFSIYVPAEDFDVVIENMFKADKRSSARASLKAMNSRILKGL